MTVDDIKRLNYIKYTSFRELAQNPHCLLKCILLYIRQLFRMIINGQFDNGEKMTKEILFVVPTINNQKSVQSILDNLPKEKCSVWIDLETILPMVRIYLHSFFYFHLFVRLYYSSSKEDRKLIRRFYTDFITACATYQTIEKTLIRNRNLKLIVLANDHILVNRCLIELSEKYHIKTLYVQHASVTTAFPSLRFDYSFLDGLESYEKYKAVGNMRGHIFLSGSPRFDGFYNYQGCNKKYDVGIAMNELDSISMVLELCLFLKRHYSDKIIVRPHVGMMNEFNDDIFLKENIAVSNPNCDLSYVFLSSIKVMVANESGIHLDAALMGVPSLLYNFSENDVMDWYSYIKKGLIKKCDTFEDVISMLGLGYHLPIDVVRYYAASFKTSQDGKVGEMIAEFINKEVFESEESALKYIDSLMVNQGEYAEYRN